MTRRLAVAAALAAAAAAAALWPAERVLVVEDAGRARVLARERVGAGSAFVVAYVHSSEHVPVRGTFRIEPDGTLRVTETAFAGFGPGLPALGANDVWRVKDGLILHESAGAPLPELRLRVVPLTRHRLRLPSGRELDLSALMDRGGPVSVRVERRAWRALGWASSSG